MILIHIPYLWIEGITLYPFVFHRKKTLPQWLINHEYIHIKQQLELGILIFYCWYLLEYLVRLIQYKNHYKAYRNICFEREAYKNDENLDYVTHRKVWAFWAYL
jgi:hypothetical protein